MTVRAKCRALWTHTVVLISVFFSPQPTYAVSMGLVHYMVCLFPLQLLLVLWTYLWKDGQAELTY